MAPASQWPPPAGARQPRKRSSRLVEVPEGAGSRVEGANRVSRSPAGVPVLRRVPPRKNQLAPSTFSEPRAPVAPQAQRQGPSGRRDSADDDRVLVEVPARPRPRVARVDVPPDDGPIGRA